MRNEEAVCSAAIGVTAGAVQGFYGGKVDLFFQRFLEIWSSMPHLYVLIIIASVLVPGFWTLLGTLLLFAVGFLAWSNGANDNFKGVASLFVALDAVNNGRFGEGIAVLKTLLQREPGHALAQPRMRELGEPPGGHVGGRRGLRQAERGRARV